MFRNIFLVVFFLLLTFFLLPMRVFAVTFDLVAPSGQLTRGQSVSFTINIDTEGTTITSSQIGISHDPAILQYQSVTPGNAMTEVEANPTDAGKYLLTGKNGSGFSGKGSFAVVNFKLIATAPGSSQLCALWTPTAPAPTSPPQPTALPRTGAVTQTMAMGIFGVGFSIVAAAAFIFLRKNEYKHPKNRKAHLS